MVNSLKTEVDLMKKTFSSNKLKLLDNMENQVKTLSYQIEVNSMSIENCVKNQQLDSFFNKFYDYAPLSALLEVKEDLHQFVAKSDIDQIEEDNKNVMKSIRGFVTKEEVMTRMEVFNADVMGKLQERPTTSYFKKILANYDKKMDNINYGLKKTNDLLDRTQKE